MAQARQTRTPENAPPANTDAIDRLLVGAVDLHCHSGPSVMPRCIDHIAAMKETADAGFRAVLIKDHYYSATPVTQLLNDNFAELGVEMLSGVPLNNATGGFNVHAVDRGIKLGAKLVWIPTFSSANHIDHHKHDGEFEDKFPTRKEQMRAPIPLSVLDQNGDLHEEVKVILDLIAENDLVLSSGHLYIREIWPLFEEAKRRGVKRLLVNHPTYIVDATMADVTTLAGMGAYLEHSKCMFIEGSIYQLYDNENLRALIEAGTIEKTILGSDLGQNKNPLPVDGFRSVVGMCLEMRYNEDAIRRMIGGNACELMGLEDVRQDAWVDAAN